jgi:ATP/maltotriose-dependent transcriptional regulator MalT/DNA-binding SARP family transcriptional activator
VPAASRLAKLSIPRVSGALVRSRLHRAIDQTAQRGAVWVAAGPGAGKTTLAASWAATRRGRVLWYRADEGDADPAAAFGYFRDLARIGRSVRALPSYTPRDLDRLDAFARSFFRAFFAIVPAAATLVVDDAHTPGSDTFATLLSAAVQEAPHDVAVVIVSRHDPAGPLLEYVTSGKIGVIDPEALAFSRTEAAELMSGRMDEGAAHRLRDKAGGWVAGILLMAQSESAPQEARLTGSERIKAYFDDRVLASFTAAELRTLAAASLLPEVNRADLVRMALDDSAVDVLERLRKRHAFVVRLDLAPPTWRLHDLLRDALSARFDTFGDEAWRWGAISIAGDIAADRGLAREAVHLRMRAGDAASALRTAEQFARALVKQHRLAELDAVAAVLEPTSAESSLPLLIALGESAWQRNDARAAVERFERAYAVVDAAAPSAAGLVIAASAVRAILEGWQDYDGLGAWAARLRNQLPARDAVEDVSDALRIDSTCLSAMDIMWGRSFGDYRALLARLLRTLTTAPRGIVADEAVAASCVLLEAAGYKLHDEQLFHDTVAATAAWLSRAELSPLTKAGWLNAYGPLGRHWPTFGVKLPAANPSECLELALRLAREHGGQSTAFTAAYFLAGVAVADNDRGNADRCLGLLREIADPRHVSNTHSILILEASVCALGGDWKRARSAIDRAFALMDEHHFPPSERWSTILSRYRIMIASGDEALARAGLLHDSAGFPEGMRRDFALILADVATAAQSLRERGEAPAELIESILRRAREYAWPGFATLLALVAARICSHALRLGIEADFVRRVIGERHLASPSPHDPHWPWAIRVHALGGLRIEIDGRPLAFGSRAQRKPLDLVKAIVAYGPAPVDTAVILDSLWPDAEGAAARAAFDMAVMRLRKLLERDDALRLDAGRIAFDPTTVWVDAHAFAHGAIDDYPGPLFGADAVEPWWAAARERLHQRFLRRTLERGTALEKAGDVDAALAIYEAGLVQDSLAEPLYQGAMRCHIAAGRAADALRVFRRCREQLSIVLSVAPSSATSAIVAGLSSR